MLKSANENDVLPLVEDIFAEPGRQLLIPGSQRDRALLRYGGEYFEPISGMPVHRQDFFLYRARGAWWLPRYGTIVLDNSIMEHSHAEAAYFAQFSRNWPVFNEALKQVGSATARRVGRAFVPMPWGATRNYGHFMLDCLPSLATFKRTAPHNWWTSIMLPPLTTWQRDHLELLRIDRFTELEDDAVYVEDIMWSNAMDHYVRYPNVNVLDIRPAAPTRPADRKIFITRGKEDRRGFPGASDLDDIFAGLHFEVVEPSGLSIREQIRLFQNARVVAGLTGSGFANVLFCPPNATIIDIMSPISREPWVANLSDLIGAKYCYYNIPGTTGEPFEADVMDISHFVASL